MIIRPWNDLRGCICVEYRFKIHQESECRRLTQRPFDFPSVLAKRIHPHNAGDWREETLRKWVGFCERGTPAGSDTRCAGGGCGEVGATAGVGKRQAPRWWELWGDPFAPGEGWAHSGGREGGPRLGGLDLGGALEELHRLLVHLRLHEVRSQPDGRAPADGGNPNEGLKVLEGLGGTVGGCSVCTLHGNAMRPQPGGRGAGGAGRQNDRIRGHFIGDTTFKTPHQLTQQRRDSMVCVPKVAHSTPPPEYQ